MTLTQTARFVRWLQKRGIGFPFRLARAARKSGIDPASAAVLIIKETGGRNVFGHDAGAPFPGEPVTHEKVMFIKATRRFNGIGPAQLTSPAWITSFPSTWDTVHRPGINMEAAFRGFKVMQKRDGVWRAAKAFNGASSYADDFVNRYHGVRLSLKGAEVI